MANIVQLLDDVDDESPLALATDAHGEVISDCRINGVQLVQTAEGIRAKHARPINRGNLVNRIQLAITHAPSPSTLAAKQAAFARLAALAVKLPTVTQVDFIWQGTTFRLKDAAMQDYDVVTRSATVWATYTFLGGAFEEVEAP